MPYTIINYKGQRAIDKEGNIAPIFDYPTQAFKYLYKNYCFSKTLQVIKVKA